MTFIAYKYKPTLNASSITEAMKPMSSASEITAKEPLFYRSMPNPANEQLQVSQGNVFATIIHHESEGVSTELKLGYGSCITAKRNSSEDLANLSVSETARAIKRMKLEEGEGPNGVSLELKLGLFDPWVIKKRIVFSDINRAKSRLLLPKNLVEKHILPQWDARRIENIKNGVQVSVWDCDTNSEHQLLFKQWSSNESYVFIESWNMEFVKRRGPNEADEIGLYWDQSNSRFSFSVLKQASSN